ncbi:MAG: hypothetical protein JJE50_15540 [Actinomycetales bacterium]|nr:hypothetical protein [Actinomycetales bacterium]
MPTVTQTRRTVQVTVSYAVAGAEPMQADYSKRVFIPERVTVTERDGDVSFTVGGWVPKKDGTPSLNGGGKHNAYNTRHLATEPEWLQNLVRDYCADAGIELP